MSHARFHAMINEEEREVTITVGFADADAAEMRGVEIGIDELAAVVAGLTNILAEARAIEAARRPVLRRVR